MATRAVLYARLSSIKGDEGESLDRQVDELSAFAKARGVTVADVICEEGVSAWTADGKARKGRWPSIVAGLQDGRWDALVVRSSDRAGRDIIETINLIRLHARVGFGFYALNGDRLDDPKAATIRGLVSEWESSEKSHRLRLKWASKAASGEYHPGRWRPYGYQYVLEDKKITGLAMDPHEAEVVREVAGRIIDGESAHSIALDLDGRGISTISGGPWARLSVLRLVKPAVAGLVAHNGTELPGSWEPILDMATYEAAQRACRPGADLPKGHNARRHLLSGIAVCGLCGVTMCGKVPGENRKTPGYPTYGCSTKNTSHGVRGCGKVGRNLEALDALITEAVLLLLETREVQAVEPITEAWADNIGTAEAEINTIQSAYESGDLTVSDWVKGLKIARQRMAEAQQARSQDMARALGRTSDHVAGSGVRQRWACMNLSQRRAVLKDLIEAVVVKPSGRGYRFDPAFIEIVWRDEE